MPEQPTACELHRMLAAILDSGDDAAIAAVVFVITETVRQNSLKDEKPVKNISQI